MEACQLEHQEFMDMMHASFEEERETREEMIRTRDAITELWRATLDAMDNLSNAVSSCTQAITATRRPQARGGRKRGAGRVSDATVGEPNAAAGDGGPLVPDTIQTPTDSPSLLAPSECKSPLVASKKGLRVQPKKKIVFSPTN